MDIKGCYKVWKKYGTKKYIQNLYMHFLIYYWKNRIDYLVSLRKGKCKQCGRCCIYTGTGKNCEYLNKDNTCSVYNIRDKIGKIQCIYAPLPITLKSNSKKWGKCGFYYEK